MRVLLLLLSFAYVTAFPAVGEDYNKMMDKRIADDLKAESERWKVLVEQLKPLAEKGDVNAQYTLGEYFRWYKKSTLSGNIQDKPNIQNKPFQVQIVLSKDDIEALKWYSKAAEQGHSKAQIAVGGYDWYLKAAAQGEPVAQYELAEIYRSRASQTLNPQRDKVMVQTNLIEAYAYYKMASICILDASSKVAMLKAVLSKSEVAKAEKRASELSLSFTKSFLLSAEGLSTLKISAEGGDANSQERLGFLYHSGYCMPQLPQDYTQAAKWYRKAADQGNAHAKYFFGASLFPRSGCSTG